MQAALVMIGRIETPYKTLGECPRNVDSQGPLCSLVIDPTYRDAMLGLDAGREILVLYWLGNADRTRLRQSPSHIGKLTGAFALRSPHRPNPIGAAVVRIVEVRENAIVVRGLDCIDGTALLDIKPAMKPESGPERFSPGRPGAE